MQVFVPKEVFRMTMSLAELQFVYSNGATNILYLTDATNTNVLKVLVGNYFPGEQPVLVTFSPPVPIAVFTAANFSGFQATHLQ